jgi:hypothetical protein
MANPDSYDPLTIPSNAPPRVRVKREVCCAEAIAGFATKRRFAMHFNRGGVAESRRCNVIFKQFYLACLAPASNIVGDEATGVAAVARTNTYPRQRGQLAASAERGVLRRPARVRTRRTRTKRKMGGPAVKANELEERRHLESLSRGQKLS